MQIAVTGATGHVGANLVRALLNRGDTVRTLVNNPRNSLDGLDVDMVRGDVRDAEAVARLVKDAELVFHLAARISISHGDTPDVESTNIGGTRTMLAACKAAGVRRVVHFSSVHALTPEPAKMRLDETRPLVTALRLPPYDRSKAVAHGHVLRAVDEGLDVVLVQPTAIIGPHDYGPSPMGKVLLNLYHRKVPALVNGGFNWVDVRDVVAGALAAAERGRTGEAYLLGCAWSSIAQVASAAAAITGQRAPRWVCPMFLARLSAPFAEIFARLVGREPLFTSIALHALRIHRDVSHDKAALELGYTPRPLHETLTDTYKWFETAQAL